MRAWLTLTALLLVFALGFLYIGSTHRDRCINAHHAGCTMLPWSGHATSRYLLGNGSGWWNTP